MNGQYPGSEWIPTNHNWKGRAGRKIRYIILHGTASPKLKTAQDVGHYYQETQRETSAHYVVGKDGHVVQCVAEEDTAWANGNMSKGHAPWWGKDGNPNFETISIEIVHIDPHNNDPMTEEQRLSVFSLVAYMVHKWDLIQPTWANETGGITGHFSIDPVGRWFCPGPFPWVDLFAYLESPTNVPLETNANSDVSKGMKVTGLLSEVPGFTGVVNGLDRIMQPQRLQDTSFRGVATWGAQSGVALSARLVLIMTGILLLGILLYALIRNNDWMGRAGYGNVPALIMRTRMQTQRAVENANGVQDQ